MAVESITINRWFASAATSIVQPGTRVNLDGGACPVELVFHTPNIVERRDAISERSVYTRYYLREDIDFREKTFLDFFRGRITSYKWRSIPEIDQGYEDTEKGILKHPLVGRKIAYLFGDEIPGIHGHLLNQGYRVEEKSDRQKKVRIVTTNTILTKALVLDGQRENIHGRPLYEQPELQVRLLEGMHEGEDMEASAGKVLLVVVNEGMRFLGKVRKDGLNSLNAEELSYLEDRGYTEDLLLWISDGHALVPESVKFRPRPISENRLNEIIDSAVAAEIDITQPITITDLGGEIVVQPAPQRIEIDSEEEGGEESGILVIV